MQIEALLLLIINFFDEGILDEIMKYLIFSQCAVIIFYGSGLFLLFDYSQVDIVTLLCKRIQFQCTFTVH